MGKKQNKKRGKVAERRREEEVPQKIYYQRVLCNQETQLT
jgi:hypothetical protein